VADGGLSCRRVDSTGLVAGATTAATAATATTTTTTAASATTACVYYLCGDVRMTTV
jgi:hypothetical protein